MAKDWWESDPIEGGSQEDWWSSDPVAEDKAPAAPAAPEPGLIDRAISGVKDLGDYVLGRGTYQPVGEGRSVMESYQPTQQDKQADIDRRLSYGAGPISPQTAAQADLVRSGTATANSPVVTKVAKAMESRGTTTVGELIDRAKRQPETEQRAGVGDFLSDAWAAASNLPNAFSAAYQALSEGSDPAAIDWKNKAILEARERAQANAEMDGAKNEYVLGITREKVRNLPQNLAFSLLSMGAGLSAGIGAGTATAATGVGAPAAPFVGYAAGAAASGVAAYRMDTNGFLRDIRDKLDAGSKRTLGRPLTDEEFVKVAQNYESLVREHGLWEALPEAVGNVVGAKAGAAIFKSAAQGIKSALAKTAAATGIEFGSELGTETVTQMGQHNVEVEAKTQRGPKRSFTNMQDWQKSAEEVLPDVLLLTGTVAGGSHIAGKVYDKTINTPERQFARALNQSVDGSSWVGGADDIARGRLNPEAYIPNAVAPESTLRSASDVGPSAPVRTANVANFTPPDSQTAQAGLAPIVVPLPWSADDQSLALGDLNVGGTGVAGAAPEQGGLGGSGELRGGVGVSGLAGGDVVRGEVSVPGGAGLGTSAALPAGVATSQRTAGLARTTDTDLLGRAEAAVAQQPSTEPVQQWFGRKGDGYTTEADAAQALPGRQRMAPALNWKIEQMPSGKFRLAGYAQETTNGTQAPQTVQGQAQGQEAPAAGAAAVDRFSALEQPQPELPDAVLAELSRDPGSTAARATVQQGLNNWAANTPGAVAPKLGAPDADAAAAVNVIGALIGDATGLGPRVVAYREEGGVNGFAMRGVALVNTASTSSVAAPRTGLHEIKHVAEQIARAETAAGLTNTPAQRFVAEIDSIFDDMTDEGKRAYVANFLQKEELDAITDPAAREQRLQELIADPETRSEMTADFLGNRATDRAFLIDLARTDPKGFEGFVKKWLAVIDNLLAKLRGSKTQNTKESAKVDQYVRDLTKAKMVARDALIAFRKGNLGEVQVEAGAEAAPQMSKKQESAAEHKMEIAREERELADRTKLTSAEMDRVRAGAKEFGLTIKAVEMEVRRIKARFPESAGWAPLEFLRIDKKTMEKKAKEDNPLPSDAVFFVEQGYKFHLDPKTGNDTEGTHDARVNAMASALAGEIMAKYMAAKAGDKVANVIMRQSDWYRALRSKLRATFGGFGDFFAQLLGPTSANNPVEPNFKYAVEALKLATSGKWDNLFKEVTAWRADIMAAAAALDDAIMAKENAMIELKKAAEEKFGKKSSKERTIFNKDGKARISAEHDSKINDAAEALKQASVYKGTIPRRENGKQFGMASKGIIQILAETWGDKVAGDAPKTKNYYQNIMGRTIDATIDVWAARTLRRLANDMVGDLPRIPPVAETAVAGNVLADNTTSGSEFGFGQEVFRKAADELRDSGVEQFRDVTPDAVQAMIWFAEKELWARRNWTTKVGEEGSIEHELLLAGYGDREQVDAWRVAARAGMPNPDTKAFLKKDGTFNQAKYDREVAKWEKAKEIAKESLAQIERYPDRFVAGITSEIPESVPTDREMASTGQEIEDVIGDDGVMAKRAQASTGEFMNDFERTLDTEFLVRTGYNPTPVWNKLVEISDREGQQATFLSRVLRADELSNIDQTRHRPGIELYFAKPISMEQAKPLMDLINAAGVHGMTMVTEGRRTPSARRGKTQPIVGIRMQHIPEFMLGYGYEADFTDAIIEENILAARDKMTALVEELDKRADIATVTRHWYETRVHFYGISERTAAGRSAASNREVWAGQSIREGLADAARFARDNQGAIGARRAELREQRAVSRRGGEEVQFSRVQPAGPAEPAGRPGGSTAASAAGANVTGIHYGKTAGLSSLSGEKSGSGIKGAERARLDQPGVDPRIKRRVYFYLTGNNTEMVRPEPGLGPHVYRARLGNIYDPTNATAEARQRVRELMADTSANAYESAILDAGYRGYMNRDYGMIVVLNSDVPVTYEGTISELRERNGGAMRSPTQAPQFSRLQAEQDEEVVQLFENLQGARGLKAVRAKDAVAAHPLGEEILRVHNDFYDILEGLEDAGLVQINC